MRWASAVSDEADLNVIRRRKRETFGVVNMPIQFVLKEHVATGR